MFEKITVDQLKENPYTLFYKKNLIAGAGSLEDHNFLTIGWGMLGNVWSKDCCIVYVKPSRYSYHYFENNDYFSLCLFDEELNPSIIRFFGTHSGKDVNKDEACNITPFTIDNTVAYKEATLIITCKKLYQGNFNKEGFIDKSIIEKRYKDELLHKEFIGEIINIYIKKKVEQ